MSPVSAPVDLEAIENAIHSWFADSSGLQVVWGEQNAPQLKSPYGTLVTLSGMQAVSPLPEHRYSTDLNREAGKEIREDVTVPCKFSISCQAYVKKGRSQDPTLSAQAYCNKAYMALDLGEYRAAFQVANFSVLGKSAIRNLNALVSTMYESRAGFDITCCTTMTLTEYTGYIEKVHAVSEQLGIDQYFGIGADSVSRLIQVYDAKTGNYVIDSETGNYVVRG